MKNIALVLLIGLLAGGCSNHDDKVARFDPPAGVTYEAHNDVEFHSFHWGTNDTTAVFGMFPHPAGLNQAMVDKMANDAGSQLEPELRKIEGVETLEKETVEISAGAFTGKEIRATLSMADGETIYQSMYLLWDGSRLWMGQLTGSTGDDLAMVRTILESKKE